MEAQLCQQEERARDRAVALRAILRDDKRMDQLLAQHDDGQLEMKVGGVGSEVEDRGREVGSVIGKWTMLVQRDDGPLEL